jgi:hypothetical protein
LTRNGRSDIGAFEYLGQSASATLSIRPITGGVVISWPVAAGDLTLEGTPALTPAVWTTVQPPPVRVGFDLVVTNATTEPAQFYRLR